MFRIDCLLRYTYLLLEFPSTMLNIQYRMHPIISDFPRREFYDAALKDGTVLPSGSILSELSPPKSRHLSARKRNLTDQIAPLLFIHHDNREEARDRSKVNFEEMNIVIAILEDLLLSNPEMKGSDIGVISPYVAQIRMLNAMLKVESDWAEYFRHRLGDVRALQLKEVEVKTVDGFEGREKDVIIFSTVRNNSYGQIGFLADRRRMNVALTRAKRALFVIGNMNTLSQAKCGGNFKDISAEQAEKNLAKLMVRGRGDEWRKYIQFLLLKNFFIEVDHPFEYRSKEEILEFEKASKRPLPLDYIHLR
jgi:superfamily I DNA and/or RNA helicase